MKMPTIKCLLKVFKQSFLLLLCLMAACSKQQYPCPSFDYAYGAAVDKDASIADPVKQPVQMDKNGRVVKKRYPNPGKKKQNK
jgi:hypothetical protein